MCLLLVMVLILASVGCSGKKNDPQKDSENTSTNQSTSSANGTGEDVFVPNKDLNLSLWWTHSTDIAYQDTLGENIVADHIKKKTRVTLDEYYGNGGQEWGPKLTTMIAGDMLPNLVVNAGGQGPAQFAKLSEGDLIWELTPDLIQKYAPNVWARTPKHMFEKIKVNDKIYGIPYAYDVSYGNIIDPKVDPSLSYFGSPSNDRFNPVATMFIRDDILKTIYPEAKSFDELKTIIDEKGKVSAEDMLDIPIKTTEEFVDFMYKIKGLGLKEGESDVYAFGYHGGDNWPALSVLGPMMMGYQNYYYLTYWNDASKEMRFGYAEPIFREAAKIQNKMLRDKVIDPESLVHSQAQWVQKTKAGRYAIYLSWAVNPDALNTQLEKQGKTYRYRPFMVNVPNRPEFPNYVEPPIWGNTVGILKTVKEAELPQVLNYIDYFFTEDFEKSYYWGPEEAGMYEALSDGTMKFKDDTFQKHFVEVAQNGSGGSGGEALLKPEEQKGLQVLNVRYFGFWVNNLSKWHPVLLNKKETYSLNGNGFKFNLDSPHVTSLKVFPPCQLWSPEYANIPIVQKFWQVRNSWEDPFKVSLTASSDVQFEKMWDEAIKTLKDTGLEELLREMNKVAKPLAEELENNK